MNISVKNKVVTGIMVVFFLGLSAFSWFKSADDFSDSERRPLAQFPNMSVKELLSGNFMSKFETYTLDQFPLRDKFRNIKAVVSSGVFGKSDNNDIYIVDGYVSKMEYPLKEASIERAAARFKYVYEKYFADSGNEVYVSIIPDKNYFMAEQNGYLSMDYEMFINGLLSGMDFAEYIDITGLLSIEDYYKTDTHWRQENIVDVAEYLAEAMGVTLTSEYEMQTLDNPFYGVYYGQAALPLPAEDMNYLTSNTLDNCQVYDYQNSKEIGIYDFEKAYGKDPYEMFVSGTLSLVTLTNPTAATEKELVIFRDSFGSSIAPLLIDGYQKITLVDIRYIHPDILGKYVEFENADVLFLYSTLVLNNAESIK